MPARAAAVCASSSVETGSEEEEDVPELELVYVELEEEPEELAVLLAVELVPEREVVAFVVEVPVMPATAVLPGTVAFAMLSPPCCPRGLRRQCTQSRPPRP